MIHNIVVLVIKLIAVVIIKVIVMNRVVMQT